MLGILDAQGFEIDRCCITTPHHTKGVDVGCLGDGAPYSLRGHIEGRAHNGGSQDTGVLRGQSACQTKVPQPPSPVFTQQDVGTEGGG